MNGFRSLLSIAAATPGPFPGRLIESGQFQRMFLTQGIDWTEMEIHAQRRCKLSSPVSD